ncbi:MAG: ABC transporter ATP-binding protein [Flavobacteriales bacterium]|jgi:iron complex transport system ATP-binding protein|nr:ABC transporter ATP-binding protein [Flavobacteriales bacterium]
MSGEMVLTSVDLAIGHGKVRLAEGLAVQLQAGSLTALLGPNGVGKSTLLNTLAGLQAPLDGQAFVTGSNIHAMPAKERARKIALVSTHRPSVALLTVEALVGLGRHPWTGPWGRFSAADAEAVERAMEQAGVLHLRTRNMEHCSDGERQKVHIARALAQETPLMLLDEPTAFLDLPNRAAIVRLLRENALKAGRAVLFSTHDLQLALDLCDRLLLLRGKDGVWHGTPQEALRSGELQRTFAGAGVQFDAEGTHRFLH